MPRTCRGALTSSSHGPAPRRVPAAWRCWPWTSRLRPRPTYASTPSRRRPRVSCPCPWTWTCTPSSWRVGSRCRLASSVRCRSRRGPLRQRRRRRCSRPGPRPGRRALRWRRWRRAMWRARAGGRCCWPRPRSPATSPGSAARATSSSSARPSSSSPRPPPRDFTGAPRRCGRCSASPTAKDGVRCRRCACATGPASGTGVSCWTWPGTSSTCPSSSGYWI
mmetsp:Transcript_65178/g.187372  ORF Transcript_65178/g.187372 Transcript_65178/m.187372 type:complete len:221 (-) Transcript_65178:1159-1821(-)